MCVLCVVASLFAGCGHPGGCHRGKYDKSFLPFLVLVFLLHRSSWLGALAPLGIRELLTLSIHSSDSANSRGLLEREDFILQRHDFQSFGHNKNVETNKKKFYLILVLSPMVSRTSWCFKLKICRVTTILDTFSIPGKRAGLMSWFRDSVIVTIMAR